MGSAKSEGLQVASAAGCSQPRAEILLAGIPKTQFHYLVHALHKRIEILGLSMASPQRGHGRDVVVVPIPFDEHSECA